PLHLSRDKENLIMSTVPFAELDQDGALAEAIDRVEGDTRADFLRKAAVTGGGLVGGGAAFAALAAPAGAQSASDVNILNFALTLEFLEAEFYTRAERGGALNGRRRLARFATVVGEHERAHVAALQKTLGRKAVRKPKFDFKGTTDDPALFGTTAATLEATGVAAYGGAAPMVQSNAVLEAAVAIHSVEARHTAWINHIIGQPPAPVAFYEPKSVSEVLAAVTATGFIAGPIMTRQGGAPGFLG
ncbi:MAG: ferritin-like domain-containing protein, partial [Actinomycetota bacterium]|nr:ferritin-like domain-containing protein [Actinomycetota bacterium]